MENHAFDVPWIMLFALNDWTFVHYSLPFFIVVLGRHGVKSNLECVATCSA